MAHGRRSAWSLTCHPHRASVIWQHFDLTVSAGHDIAHQSRRLRYQRLTQSIGRAASAHVVSVVIGVRHGNVVVLLSKPGPSKMASLKIIDRTYRTKINMRLG